MQSSPRLSTNSEELNDITKSPSNSDSSKTESTKGDNSFTTLSDNEIRAQEYQRYFEYFGEDISYGQELETCLLTELLEALDRCDDDVKPIENSNIPEQDKSDSSPKNQEKIGINPDQPEFVPKYISLKDKVKFQNEEKDDSYCLVKKKQHLKKEKKYYLGKNNKRFVKKEGDWTCFRCKNINFSFRTLCNRCRLPKISSDKLVDETMDILVSFFNPKA